VISAVVVSSIATGIIVGFGTESVPSSVMDTQAEKGNQGQEGDSHVDGTDQGKLADNPYNGSIQSESQFGTTLGHTTIENNRSSNPTVRASGSHGISDNREGSGNGVEGGGEAAGNEGIVNNEGGNAESAGIGGSATHDEQQSVIHSDPNYVTDFISSNEQGGGQSDTAENPSSNPAQSSLLVIPEDGERAVGGQLLSIDMTSLFVAGSFAIVVWILVVAAFVAAVIVVLRIRRILK
jgi:hypothetical protein